MPPYDAGRDLDILSAMVGQLQPYLISDQLFWPISGRLRGGMPRLTVGGLVLRQHRLEALRALLSDRQQEALAEELAAFDQTRREWVMHYYSKIEREWPMRVHLLDEFLRDCDEKGGAACLENWPVQAEGRTILHLLLAELVARSPDSASAQEADLRRVDADLRRFLLAGEEGCFLWARELERVYPRDTFWWLWTAPGEETDETPA